MKEIGSDEVVVVLRGWIFGDRRPMLATIVCDLGDETTVTGCDIRRCAFGMGDGGGVDGEFHGVVVMGLL